jgi:acetyl esterase/lipase
MSASIYKDIAYSDNSARNVLDIYLPTSSKPFPVLIWIHGGAFRMGDKANPPSLERLLSEGFAVVSINYRYSSEAKWPAQLEDLANAVRFIKTNAISYGFDPNRLAAWGASAGGHFASMMGIALAGQEESRIHAVINWYGPIHFSEMDNDIAKTGVERKTGPNSEADSPESQLIGATVKDNLELAYRASPLFYLEQAKAVPPFLIMHGAQDALISAIQSERLRDALKTKFGANAAEYYYLNKGGHGGGEFESAQTEAIIMAFLNQIFKAN